MPHGVQFIPSGMPDPVQAPLEQPAHAAQCPVPHWESVVHQHGMPAPPHAPPGAVTVSHAPVVHDHAVATEASTWQAVPSAAPLPLQPPVHWLLAFTHLPLEQSESATQRHSVWAALHTGAGDSVVAHVKAGALPPELTLIHP
jgi:hypothetical protein